jgi:UDP-3-O-[3-hydroxymyristoyl] glucosamine N-acyltransferase
MCVSAATVMLPPTAHANPSDADINFLNEVYPYAHPPVSPQALMQLGHQACGVRQSGGSTGDAKVSIWNSLNAQGVVGSNAEIGSLVHAAVDQLCPEVGYP